MSATTSGYKTPAQARQTNPDDRSRSRRRAAGKAEFLWLVVEGERPLAGGDRYSLEGVDEVVIGSGRERSATRLKAGGLTRLVLSVPSSVMSARHATFRRTKIGWLIEDTDSTNGTYVNGKKVPRHLLGREDVAEAGWTLFVVGEADVPSSAASTTDLGAAQVMGRPAGFQTLLPSLEGDLSNLKEIASSRVPVLLVGEPGTGKEVLSRAIHGLSGRRGGYVGVNCAAIPVELVESELFGHTRGAFSGAMADRAGHVRSADGGTLLLDEIMTCSPSVQSALLRVIQEGHVVAVGASSPVRVDVRFIATAQRSLDEGVAAGTFRADLRDRLQGFVFPLIPLRRRRVDLGLLVAHLLRRLGITDDDRPRLLPDAALEMVRHDWPGNIRELELTLQRSWVLARDGEIADLGLLPRPDQVAEHEVTLPPAELKRWLIDSLEASGGNVSEAARRMGRSRPLVHRWLRKLAINPDSFRRR